MLIFQFIFQYTTSLRTRPTGSLFSMAFAITFEQYFSSFPPFELVASFLLVSFHFIPLLPVEDIFFFPPYLSLYSLLDATLSR